VAHVINPWRRLQLAVVAIAGAAAIASGCGGGSRVDPAAKVAACEHAHRLSRAEQVRVSRAGESRVERPAGSGQIFDQHTYESCTWPPGAGADPDGYGTIVVTEVAGPGQSEASFRDAADRIESKCPRLRLRYSYGSMGQFARLRPFTARGGEIWAYSGASSGTAFAPVRTTGLNLPFYPVSNEVDVLRNFRTRLDGVICAS
jgi:hypothetical protein